MCSNHSCLLPEWLRNVTLQSYSPMEGVKYFGCLVNRLPTGPSHGCASHKISYGSSYSGIPEGSTFSDWPTEIRTDYNLSFNEVNYLHQAFPLFMKICQNHVPRPPFFCSRNLQHMHRHENLTWTPFEVTFKGRIATQSSDSLGGYLDIRPFRIHCVNAMLTDERMIFLLWSNHNCVVRLPLLNRRNWRTSAIFKILLTEHANSGLRKHQVVTCHQVQFFFFWVWYV